MSITHFLTGKKAICNFVGRSWGTVELWILHRGFPAQLLNGIWESDSELITKWRRRQVANGRKKTKRLVNSRGNPNLQ
jgi:hypothetical protein